MTGPRAAHVVILIPGVPVGLPGTNVELRWDGEGEAALVRGTNGIWDLSPLARRGRVLLWQRLADRPHLGWWPLLPVAVPRIYRAAVREERL